MYIKTGIRDEGNRMTDNPFINPVDIKTFRLEELAGKTIAIKKFVNDESIITVGVDVNTGFMYVLQMIYGRKKKRGFANAS